MVLAGGVIVTTSGRVRESEVGIIDFLEFFGSGGSFWRVRWNSIRMRLQRLSDRALKH